jgi:hypothetical protein
VPQHEVPLALFMFNVGVETGQLLFVCVVVLVRELLQRLPVNWPDQSWRFLPYTIGGISSFWVIERVSSFA